MRKVFRRTGLMISVTAAALALSSCASAPLHPPYRPSAEISPTLPSPLMRSDISHTVAPGETLWRISKMYSVRIEDVMRANNLKTPTQLEIGQRLLIPRAAPIIPVIPLYPSDKWRYIIIHHSASDEGSAQSINNVHYVRGFWKGLGYHFVIDNGTKGKADGQIEVSPRWLHQDDGAHCKASAMNRRGIGICIVGNFSRDTVSPAQLESLAYLVNILRRFYRISQKNILGHGQVHGARTECPGKFFPWQEFKRKIAGADYN